MSIIPLRILFLKVGQNKRNPWLLRNIKSIIIAISIEVIRNGPLFWAILVRNQKSLWIYKHPD